MRTIVKISVSLGALSLAIGADGRADDQIVGSLYPNDVVEPLKVAQADNQPRQSPDLAPADNVITAPNTASASPALANALGSASYVLRHAPIREQFSAKIRQAVGRHPAFHAQIATLDQSRAEQKRARSSLYPQLSTQFRGDYAIARRFGADTDNVVESLRPREQFTAGLSASQLVFDGGATFQRIKSARARHSEFKNAISTRVNDLSFQALSAYHDLLTHQALVALGDQIILRHEKILADVEERERLGAGARADVTRANARLAAARARVSEIRESAKLAEIRYGEFFGEEPGLLARPGFDALSVASRDDAVAKAMNFNPELDVAASRAQASTADFKAAKGERLPEVRLSVDAVKYDVFNGGDDHDIRAGLDVQYNIFGGGLRAANIAEAGSRARQARFNEENIRREIARDAAFAFERRNGAQARLAALETAVIAHDETRDLVLERYRVSRGDLIDVLQAENDYFEAAVAYLTGLANKDMSTYALMEHTGDLLRFFSPQENSGATLIEAANG